MKTLQYCKESIQQLIQNVSTKKINKETQVNTMEI